MQAADAEGQLLDADFLSKIDQLEIISRKVIMGKIHGERLTRKRGQSVEFADYRSYVHGDDLRMIDWNIYGRLEKLFLKLFFEEEDLHVHIIIDASASMGFGKPSKLFYAKKVAAALGYIALSNYDRVIIGVASRRPPRRAPCAARQAQRHPHARLPRPRAPRGRYGSIRRLSRPSPSPTGPKASSSS